MSADAAPLSRVPSRRAEVMTYASGMLIDSQGELIGFIIPLWALVLGLGPLELGILISAKAVLPSILAIHGGVLMDRFGTRLILVIMGAACTLMPPLFPIATWFPALLLLQMAMGTVNSFGWIGAQAVVVRIGKDDPRIMSRFSFFARVGVMGAPIVAGVLWDLFAPWVAFTTVAVVGAAFWVAVRALPKDELGADLGAGEERPPFRLRDLLPSLGDYIGAIGLLVIPAVAFVVIVSSVRMTSALMQQSFYILYLKDLGLQATVIGTFISLSQMMAAAGTLSASWVLRFTTPSRLFLVAVTLSILFVYGTPLFGSALAVLALAIAFRGFNQGLSQPVMYTILSRAVGRDIQATSIGLRATGNRIATLVMPVLMGAVAELWGLNSTFYVCGALLLAILGATGLWMARHPWERKA